MAGEELGDGGLAGAGEADQENGERHGGIPSATGVCAGAVIYSDPGRWARAAARRCAVECAFAATGSGRTPSVDAGATDRLGASRPMTASRQGSEPCRRSDPEAG
ncbi:hypothetical protein GCM10010232_02360 [Streptomyces amakusaensis]